jgi:anti-sigma regulatory factor (Ser/Thr protein kinase)
MREARHAVAQWAIEVGATCVIEVVVLLVSELATNAVNHAQTAYTMTARWRPPVFRVEITDAAPSFRLAQRRPGQPGGWGLEMVGQLSHHWGIDGHAPGKTVWFDIEQPAQSPR